MRQQVAAQLYASNTAVTGVPIVYPEDPNYAYYGYSEAYEEEELDEAGNKKNTIPMHGNSTNFNINNLLFNNIMENDYFRALYQLRTYHEVIAEIQANVNHVEPWQAGTSRYPSTAFCLLVKFLLMKLTVKQMNGLLKAQDCAYVRAIGFLYLRYSCPPNELWKWFDKYLEDDQEILPSADKSLKMTVGSYCIKLLTDMHYFGTTLPRIPVLIERKFKVMLLLLEERKKRRAENSLMLDRFQVGTKVRAIYSDEENEPAWYEAVIDSIEEDSETRFWVTFPEYGNSECVDLGDMELLDKPKKERSNNKDHKRERSRSRDSRNSKDRNTDSRSTDLMAKVIQSEREASLAVGRNYAQRPTSYKGSLSLKQDRYTVRRKSPSPEKRRRNRSRSRSRSRSDSRSRRRHERTRDHESSRSTTATNNNTSNSSSNQLHPSQQQERLNKLKELYGDASAK